MLSNRTIIIAIETLGGGGAERVALDLARHWPKDHAQPVLLVAERRGAYVSELSHDIPVLEVGLSSSPRNTIVFLRRLRELLRGRRVAGVISHMTGMNRMMLRARMAGVVGTPIVVVEHCDFVRNQGLAEMHWLKSSLLRAEIGFLYRRAHCVVGCSRGVARQIGQLFGVEQSRLHAIPNPLATRFRPETSMDPAVATWFERLPRPILVSVGRLERQKGFDDLIRAFAMNKRGALVILGEGPLRAELEALSRELGVSDRVVLPGFLNAPEQVLQAADLYVSSSHWEGYPLTLIEAYASGLPIVARDCDFGPSEIIRAGRPGRLVRGGEVSDLAAAIADCLENERRFRPGTLIDLSENDPDYVARRYRGLLPA